MKLSIICRNCRKAVIHFDVTVDAYVAYRKGTPAAEAFSGMTAADRKRWINRLCEKCEQKRIN